MNKRGNIFKWSKLCVNQVRVEESCEFNRSVRKLYVKLVKVVLLIKHFFFCVNVVENSLNSSIKFW